MNWRGGAYPRGTHGVTECGLSLGTTIYNVYGLGVWFWNFSEILSFIWIKGSGAYPQRTNGRCHRMCHIIRKNNIYSLGVGFWTVSEILNLIWTGGGRSVSLNVSYHKKQQCMWLRGGVLNSIRDIKPYLNRSGWGIPPRGPTVSVTESVLS